MSTQRRKGGKVAAADLFTAPVPNVQSVAQAQSRTHDAPPPSMVKRRKETTSEPAQPQNTQPKAVADVSHRDKAVTVIKSATPRLLGLIPAPRCLTSLLFGAVFIAACVVASSFAYNLRTYAIKEYGPIIHEFDPWFNFRATEYLAEHGAAKFFSWYDYMSWYPIGRPVGTTIYPGMQFFAVWIWKFLGIVAAPFKAAVAAATPYLGSFPRAAKTLASAARMLPMSLNDVCVYIPCWFAAGASILTGLMAGEAAGSWLVAAATAVVMAVIPAHLMRSIGGGFDNECVAIACLALVFWLWVRALREPPTAAAAARCAVVGAACGVTTSPWLAGAAAGVAYFAMAAAWGGYIFVGNLVACHAAFVTAVDWIMLGVWTPRVWRAYAAFYIVGTFLATRVPVIGLTPLRSLEQLPMLAVLVGLLLLAYSERLRTASAPAPAIRSVRGTALRFRVFAAAAVVALVPIYVAYTQGYFGPLSARVRGLFVAHTRTGNPLVDSVAEHHPASEGDIGYYFETWWELKDFGLVALAVAVFVTRQAAWRQASFVALFFYVVQFFMLKMSRLLLLAGPVVAALCGILVGVAADVVVAQFIWQPTERRTATGAVDRAMNAAKTVWEYPLTRALRIAAVLYAVSVLVPLAVAQWPKMYAKSMSVARGSSHPHIMFKGRTKDGREVLVDDYYRGYLWLRDNTPEDARVMAWWDYGYQITGIGNRTSIADGNTWNHEHIATLGKILTSPVKRAHAYIRHLADYVLVWSGGSGDDLAKSTHLVRIGHSVFRDTCGDDPLCEKFGFSREGPTPMMAKSLLFNLCLHGQYGVHVPENLFKLVWSGKNDMMRIYKVMNVSKESKAWVADPANRICDHEGSWSCRGQFPPAPIIQNLLAKRLSFSQLEDFNKGGGDADYHEKYMSRFNKE